ncbi:MAG: NAD(P)-binding protein [Methanosarcinales archaeon]|uniref:CoB--CoM heterodisulfide reductase iron-sulfur subunit A n=1 Tax=Candidatus Ethanoperedens thermophilum TaxID=2766897 RepID=A0A848D8X7_9EURY|nr:NAD(P)-binding protein [Candidatus Ethanoperedens thermophilum]
MEKVGSVLVVGGGVGGIQASLDLADSGYKVYLIEHKPSIGGGMAQLDKTFPTCDCSLCIESPKLVESSRHPNIDVLGYTELLSVDGESGNFIAKIKKKTRHVDINICTGCGLCTQKCVVKGIPSEFDEGIGERRAIYIPFSQAVPNKATIDIDHCRIFAQNKICKVCQKACTAGAIDYDLKDEYVDLNVGAILFATGAVPYDPSQLKQYLPDHPDVLTAMQFERLMCANGPTVGHVKRFSDGKEPKRIAFIQCVGSRNPKIGIEYCSAVCCNYATKESIITKEHNRDIDISIFYMDYRACGKGFEEFYKRGQDDYGINYVRSRVAEVYESDGNLNVKYEDLAHAKVKEESFDMVILSVGLSQPKKTQELLTSIGVDLNEFGNVATTIDHPVETNIKGIFVCGTAQGPKDIPETVAQSSGAAGKIGSLLSEARNTLTTKKELPPEKDVLGLEPRIGVFVCHCGINIGSIVNVPEVVEYVKTLPNVVYATEVPYACSDDGNKQIFNKIHELDLSRVVMAACTPRTHEPLFHATCAEAGLNPFLFEFANIREHCSWIHMNEKEKATEKAKEIVRMSIAKARLLEPLGRGEIPVNQKALVIGAGISGMSAALDLAAGGFPVYLVERTGELGGLLKHITSLPNGEDPEQIVSNTIKKVEENNLITVYPNSEVSDVSGSVGDFKAKIVSPEKEEEIDFGIAIIATGGEAFKPEGYYGYDGKRVITQFELEQIIDKVEANTIVMIQCVGSREEAPRTYCSKICCTEAVKNAIRIKEQKPKTEIFILYKDVRTYGTNEVLYTKAREAGVIFVRYDDDRKPVVNEYVDVYDEFIGENIKIKPDLVVLSTPMVPNDDNAEVGKMFKVPLAPTKFFFEAHVKLRPVDFATDGVYLCGLAHGPKPIDECIAQASAAAGRASIPLAAGKVIAEAIVASANEERCVGCAICEDKCAYLAVSIEDGKAVVNKAMCKGCGTCVTACPTGAMEQLHFKNNQILAQVKHAFAW